ncbi:Peptidase S24/S26A/S26B [Kalmanozyma brasiliensis GHG001]|uniref:Peptidase S24/S26A/S26B n=1 Tax=Kalmanozyma brasiliensis (strain GHG001) TaxID=1365824 RepID=UPI00286825B8|nr:Peptidase S24/S26A/S26B [Kalmanozyma brasiliensis GHG001]EST06049.2 Peptidase S24/S26A/S26B [Kalmanozyma brasiliensis GHG001]
MAFRPASRVGFRRPWISRAAYTSAIALQVACTAHLINEHVFEIRNSTGASMLPTLAPEGDFLLQLRLPFARFLASLRDLTSSKEQTDEEGAHPYRSGKGRIGGPTFSKTDQAQGTGLKVGDLVVALSPFDPSRTVCKRVIGLPGDTVALDPRMRPLPMHAWRGRKAEPRPEGGNKDDKLDSRMVKFEDLLASVGEPVEPGSRRSTTMNNSDVDLLKSMDTDAPHSREDDTQRHNSAAATEISNTYIRSKGDVQYVTVPLGHVWLAGDNMGNSTDSRHYGPVPLGMVRGKVLARVYPNPRWLTNNLSFVD